MFSGAITVAVYSIWLFICKNKTKERKERKKRLQELPCSRFKHPFKPSAVCALGTNVQLPKCHAINVQLYNAMLPCWRASKHNANQSLAKQRQVSCLKQNKQTKKIKSSFTDANTVIWSQAERCDTIFFSFVCVSCLHFIYSYRVMKSLASSLKDAQFYSSKGGRPMLMSYFANNQC